MKKYIFGVSDRCFFLIDSCETKPLCVFQIGDYVKIKALLKSEYSAYIEGIVITKERTFLRINSEINGFRDTIPVDTIEHMEVLEAVK